MQTVLLLIQLFLLPTKRLEIEMKVTGVDLFYLVLQKITNQVVWQILKESFLQQTRNSVEILIMTIQVH